MSTVLLPASKDVRDMLSGLVGKPVTVSGITISGGDSGNYSLTQPSPTANITAKALTVTGVTAGVAAPSAEELATLPRAGAPPELASIAELEEQMTRWREDCEIQRYTNV